METENIDLSAIPLSVLKDIVDKRERAERQTYEAKMRQRVAHIHCACGKPATVMAEAQLTYRFRGVDLDTHLGSVDTTSLHGSGWEEQTHCPGVEPNLLVWLACDNIECQEGQEWRSIPASEFWRVTF